MNQSQDAVIADLKNAIAAVESSPEPAPEDTPNRDPEYLRAKKRALNMLGARDHSSAELKSKLLAREHPEEIVDELIGKLERSGLLNDAQYAQNFVRAKREERSLSKSALNRELNKKGIAQEAITQAVEPIADEHELAFGVAMKKARATIGLPRETRERRILGMLARRGFPAGICIDVTRRALDET